MSVKKMRVIREERKISLRELAKQLEVNHSTISYWEKGLRNPDRVNMEKLQKYFDMDIEELLSDVDNYTGENQLTH